jgi:hypothetical protein
MTKAICYERYARPLTKPAESQRIFYLRKSLNRSFSDENQLSQKAALCSEN